MWTPAFGAGPEPQRLAELFRQLHGQPGARREAEQELERLGVRSEHVETGRMLFDPDPEVRLRLARKIAGLDPSSRDFFAARLLEDEDARVRTAVLDQLGQAGNGRVGNAVRQQVRRLSKGDPSRTVAGLAALLVADWTLRGDTGPRGDSAPADDEGAGDVSGPLRDTGEAVPAIGASTPSAPDEQASRDDRIGRVDVRREVDLLSYWPDEESAPSDGAGNADTRPGILERPLEGEPGELPFDDAASDRLPQPFTTSRDAPLGFTGPSGVLPREAPGTPHFVPIEDRWRVGVPEWDRYGKEHPPVDDYPGVEGHWWDPYNQNVLKGDYPIIGQHTFLRVTATSLTTLEWREAPTGTTPFESTRDSGQFAFFGDPAQSFVDEKLILSLDLFHGNTAFKPVDWQVRLTPVIDFNYLDVNELGIVNPDVTKGTRRSRDDVTLQEYFVEAKLADLGPDYDFASVRAGSQLFNSDFRGFLFFDTNRAVRLFGTRLGSRDAFNLIFFDMLEKETNSELNTFDDRHQNVLIANYYRQDFVFPGYTAQVSMHYNNDQESFQFDRNDFLVRPDPAGVFQPHELDVFYIGFAGDGHIRRFNVNHALYWAVGRDSLNPIGGREQDIDAYMGAIELSYDRDWIRFRTSFFYASGDDDVFDDKAEGFDTILDEPIFAGGNFSYWQRQALRLFGVNVTQRKSLVANLRSSKIQGQSNFVNPGLVLVNAGMDFEITPKLRVITNVNYLWFDSTAVLETFTFQDRIAPEIGLDSSVGVEYRPLLNDNIVLLFGYSNLIPGRGFDDLFGQPVPFTLDNARNVEAEPLHALFFELAMTY